MKGAAFSAILLAAVLGAAIPGIQAQSAPGKTGPPATAPEMVTYYFGMLVKGPKWTPGPTPELEKLQEEHLAHIGSMAKTGKLVVAGPLSDNGFIRGILIFKTATLEEAKALAESDPAVKAGRLVVEIHPWMVQKGVLP
jgi:uncharacterized protein YciI